MSEELNLDSMRANKARLAARIGDGGGRLSSILFLLLILAGAGLYPSEDTRRISSICLAMGLMAFMIYSWYRFDLKKMPGKASADSLDQLLAANLLAAFNKRQSPSPSSAWTAALHTWQGSFLANHLLLDTAKVAQELSSTSVAVPGVWQSARELMIKQNSAELDGGALAAAILISPEAKSYLASINLRPEDVLEAYGWEERLNQYIHQPKPYFGGVGRDWAAGYTPTLDRFGENLSRSVEAGIGHYHTLAHADVLDSVIHNLGHGSGLAIVGEAGTGKTALAYALAERLLEGHDESLRYYQIVSLNASQILSASGDKLEEIMLMLFGEAVHARNIIIFLDEARLFFGKGAGAFDMSQILMPLLQNHSVKVMAAFTPNDFQHLKTTNEALTASMASVLVREPPADVVMKILEDSALTLEQREGIMVSFGAVREAYRLAGQYFQDQAYPGKAINLMEQALPYVQGKVMTAESIQASVEKTRGIKVSKAEGPETDMLLHLEDKIHQRMINQERAVSVIAAALRRGRAGVANPNRPVGSFLFLGPTGVGKTELARSLAATYFGDEQRMIRLDMSEYQRPDDVARLLDSGATSTKSLIMSIREQPFSVVLLDEVEKAHPDILNLLLQLLDEGQLTDQNGKPASFRNAIIINTSNAGSAEITAKVEAGQSLDNYERPLIDKLIGNGLFKPELINRFDEIVLFRPLNETELAKVALLMLAGVNKTLANQNVSVKLTEEALIKVVQVGYDPQFGARPMRHAIQKMVEDAVASRILNGQAQPGSVITLDVNDLSPVS